RALRARSAARARGRSCAGILARDARPSPRESGERVASAPPARLRAFSTRYGREPGEGQFVSREAPPPPPPPPPPHPPPPPSLRSATRLPALAGGGRKLSPPPALNVL